MPLWFLTSGLLFAADAAVPPPAWHAWMAIGVLMLVFAGLITSRLAPDLVLIAGVVLLLFAGVIDVKDALAGMSNEGMITVGVLFVVTAGVVETGAVALLANRLFGRPKTDQQALLRLLMPTAALSAFMNNTPLVAMLIPAVSDWSKQHRLTVSKLMLPLSYAAILGGTCTLIGTSTNLVVQGLVIQTAKDPELQAKFHLPAEGLRMFDITPVGLPAALAGLAFLYLGQRWLLPDRKPVISEMGDPREYTVEMLVAPDGPLVGKTIEQAGLRHLQGVYLGEIERDGDVIPAVSPTEKLRGNDRLIFVGVVDSVVDLHRVRGLLPAGNQVFKLGTPRANRCLIEAVVSPSCPMVSKTIRDGKFRTNYNAVVIAVARNGERVQRKIGDIVLKPGDTLMLEAHPAFIQQQRNNRDFLLVSRLENTNPLRHERAWLALPIMLAMVVAMSTNWLSPLKAAMLASGLMLLGRCCSTSQARKAVDWSVLLSIAASFALSIALEKSGAAATIAHGMIGLAGGHPLTTLAVFYFVTLVTTEMITNNAAAALMFPFALATSEQLGVNAMPFIIVIMMAASAGFATPIGYQTNLMVYGPGGYKFTDYVKVGVPLDLLIMAVTILVTPWFFPFAIAAK